MSRFLVFYFLIYGGANAYAGARLWPAARRLGPWGGLLLVPVVIFLFAAPLLARRLESRGLLIAGQIVGFAGYLWMAAMLWFFFLGIAVELWNGIGWLAARWRPEARRMLLPWRIALPAMRAEKSASVQLKSSTRLARSSPWRGAKSGSAVSCAKRFHGHTSWQSSQP